MFTQSLKSEIRWAHRQLTHTFAQSVLGWTAPEALNGKQQVLSDRCGMQKMLFHNKLLSNTAGQVNMSLRFCECVCVCVLLINLTVWENLSPKRVCVWLCVKVANLAWWRGLSQQRLDVQTAEHKGGKKGEAIHQTAHVGTHAQICTQKKKSVITQKKVSLWKMDLTVLVCVRFYNIDSELSGKY